ncbi:phosphatidylinositol 4,5-bisphosphate-binding protein [Elasticomyces elasticus]|uniref:Phosphatidylinositol 4,5-bisphosphate-binding protein n=1 Tax=Exophiala sideris TaxID=1016849 RepID=A0ABR0J6S9_9EURO|nr:phosphatidylinositol 4,5-bisphosphate-binding protein [Elasticomyces elasticus]KAK5029313.1 phosphatidylinositol 4,5-bisphosphate-binding protein [Exophiala sideris]KAK5036993.1 phosphatidylinositol 4,5-bisphosphate-binding protein [Exophiala sideris]KAK5057943.1 phosphatidylinositol 4,5-bisphosphate-binding protein [Exophiala sideris]KAK5181902.1 phosphatidylinositol 4,5-bisphosphate-binding protein [Eurotiomycetes sp. CCFEE 6388]
MASRPVTPSSPIHSALPSHEDPSVYSARPTSAKPASRPVSYVGTHVTHHTDAPSHYEAPQSLPQEPSALSHTDELDHEFHDTNEQASELPGNESHISGTQTLTPSRGGTLKKKASLHKSASVKRSASKRSSYAGSVRSVQLAEKEKYAETEETNSVFYCPVPTTGNPTELLATRFQAWRRVLKDIIAYFRELHKTYDLKAKSLGSAGSAINNTALLPNFLTSGGIGDAIHILRDFHGKALNEANKARDLENEVIIQLTGLRSDLQQKIKEIKSLSGDFKNSVSKEQESSQRAVRSLQESLGMVDSDAATTSGKGDPFLVKLSVDKQIEKQIEEENYLHRAYLNLEASGRELESIVVGEIQKAYNVLAGILRREADENYDVADKLKEGPLQMPKDHEWDEFTSKNDQMVDPRRPVRQYTNIVYPGKDHPAAIEVRSGMLERKSKYLKNYTPGWYILSPTHLHEFKSADRVSSQSPVMSLYLPEQNLGSYSEPGSSSHKFMLKGRQSGSMHRGHSWVFRAETHDTMLAWYTDIKELTSRRGEERNEFVRRTHARSFSGNSFKPASIISSEGGMEEDEADHIAFAGEQSVRGNSVAEDGGPAGAAAGGLGVLGTDGLDDNRSEAGWRPPQQRPAPGGRFPSDLNIQRGLEAPQSPSSLDDSDRDRDVIAAAGGLPGSGVPFADTVERHTELQPGTQQSGIQQSDMQQSGMPHQPGMYQPAAHEPSGLDRSMSTNGQYATGQHPNLFPNAHQSAPSAGPPSALDGGSSYGEWMAPIAAGAGGAAVGAGVMHHHDHQPQQQQQEQQQQPAAEEPIHQHDAETAIPGPGESSAPIMVATAAPVDAPTAPRAMSESTTAPSSAVANSGTDVATLSTVPTSTGYVNDSMFDYNGVFVGPRTAQTEPTHYTLKTADRSKSSTTISHLHIPGEFPVTTPLKEQARLYSDVIEQ